MPCCCSLVPPEVSVAFGLPAAEKFKNQKPANWKSYCSIAYTLAWQIFKAHVDFSLAGSLNRPRTGRSTAKNSDDQSSPEREVDSGTPRFSRDILLQQRNVMVSAT